MKHEYKKPELEIIIPAESLLETQPKDSHEHEEDISAKPDFDYDEEDKGDSAWDE